MSKIEPDRALPLINEENARKAWQLAATRMPRLSRLIFRLHLRDRTYREIGRRLRISQRRVRRGMVDAIMHIDLAFREIAERERS